MCIRDSLTGAGFGGCTVSLVVNACVPAVVDALQREVARRTGLTPQIYLSGAEAVSYTHLRAHETVLDLVCRLLLEKKKNTPYKLHHTLTHYSISST